MASIIKVDNVQNTPGTNIVSKCGTDVTVGASGDTVALACGASQTGFGRTGTVDWVTTPKVTGDSPVTAATGSGYFLNTTAGTITINLPAGAAGSIVSMADYAATWQTNNVTVSPNGSEKIGGIAASSTLSTEGQSVTFVYVDSTQGWINTMDSTSNVRGTPPFVEASGGNTTLTVGDYKTHVFTGPGNLCVTQGGTPAGSDTVEYLVVAGGGGGGNAQGGGGASGGWRSYTALTPATPINGPAGLPVSISCYTVTVGAGGGVAAQGSPATFSSITSAGGGYAPSDPGSRNGSPGGSGGGGSWGDAGSGTGGTGNDPPTSPAQGTNGGNSGGPGTAYGGGGGGAIVAGNPNSSGGCGTFVDDDFFGPTAPSYGCSPGPLAPNGRYFGGGGGGRPRCGGGCGGGVGGSPLYNVPPMCGVVNTGSGGSSAYPSPAGSGGSGIVVIRYKFQ